MTRNELRERLRQKRRALGEEERERTSAAAVGAILASPLFAEAELILLYAPVRDELDLTSLLLPALSGGKTVAFPRCREGGEMDFFAVESTEALVSGFRGIPEPPADAPTVTPDKKTLCILPGLGFDPAGNRIGYGGGYYDRYLARYPDMRTLGVCHSSLLLRHIPARPHDRSVSALLTEKGFLVSPAKREETPASPPPAPAAAPEERLAHLRALGERLLRSPARKAPPLLLLCIFVLLLLSRALAVRFLTRETESMGLILLQLPVFLLPCIVYCRLRGISLSRRLRLTPPRPEHLLLFLTLLVMMISGGLLTSILTGGIHSLGGEFTLYDTFTAHLGDPAGRFAAILAYAVLPAICEEPVFRAVLTAEYEGFGTAIAVAVSALSFAMLHFSIPHFLTYLFLGALLAAGMYATRSVWTAVLLHLSYNLFCLFGQPYLSAFYNNAGSTEIFLFCLGILFLLSSALAAGEARKLYHLYARANLDSSYTRPLPLRETPRALWRAVATPLWLLPAGIFLVTALLSLYA